MSRRHRGIVLRASTTSTYQRRWSTATGGLKVGHNWTKTLLAAPAPEPKTFAELSREGCGRSRFKERRRLVRRLHPKGGAR